MEEENKNIVNNELNKEAVDKKSKEEKAETPNEEKVQDASNESDEKEAPLDEIKGDYNEKKATSGVENAFFKTVTYINDGTRTFDEDIERIRKTNLSKMNSSKIFDYLFLGLMVLAFIGVILVTFLNKNGSKVLTYSVVGVAFAIIIAGFILSSVLNKKKSKIVNEYLDQYEDATYGYVLSNINVKDLQYCVNAKIDDQDIIQAHYFRTINAIQSRAGVTGKRNGLDFHGAEVAVSIPSVPYTSTNAKPTDLINLDGSKYDPQTTETMTGTQEFATKDMTLIDLNVASEASGSSKIQERRNKDAQKAALKNGRNNETSTGFFGKYFSYDMKVHSSEAIIISFMGDKEYTVLPDYLNGYHAIKVLGLRSNIVVYATDISASKVFFDDEAVKTLNEVSPDLYVQSALLSINSYGTKVGLTLSDDIMSLPVKPLKHVGTFDSFKNALTHIFQFIDSVDEKRMK